MKVQHGRVLEIVLMSLAVLLVNLTLAAPLRAQASSTKGQRSPKTAQSKPSAQNSKSVKLDVNSASKEELDALPGIGGAYAQKIIDGRPYDGRPYKAKTDLVSKGVLPSSTYEKIKDQITARRGGKASASESSTATPSEPSSSNAAAVSKTSDQSPTTSSRSERQITQNASQTARIPPEKGMVWVNTSTGVYHRDGDRWYGKTKKGKFMSEADAQKAGFRPAKNGPKE
jgi:DNA uptake protein ComE-like DNA-binding protein